MEECDRILVPGGVIAINIIDTLIRNQNKADTIVAAMHRYQSLLKKQNIYLTDVIHWVAPQDYRNAKAFKGLSEEIRHTTYDMQSFTPPSTFSASLVNVSPRWTKSSAGPVSAKMIGRNWCSGVWEIQPADDGEYPETFPEELVRRLIKFSPSKVTLSSIPSWAPAPPSRLLANFTAKVSVMNGNRSWSPCHPEKAGTPASSATKNR
jgi:DNA modification methylase